MTLVEHPVVFPSLLKFDLPKALHPHDEATVNFLRYVTAVLGNLAARFMAACSLQVSTDVAKFPFSLGPAASDVASGVPICA